jgi:hypothetical protein
MTKDEALRLASVVLEHCYGHHAVNDDMIEQTAKVIQAALEAKDEPVKLRRGDILRCIETDELCTVWATSTSGKTLIKWGSNDFTDYTAEQIGELFWLEPKAKDEPVAIVAEIHMSRYTIEWINGDLPEGTKLYTTPPQRTWVGLTRMELIKCGVLPFGMSYELYEAIEQALKERNT